jgi:hypothetical protein
VILKYCVFCKLTDKSIAKDFRRRSKDLKNELKKMVIIKKLLQRKYSEDRII